MVGKLFKVIFTQDARRSVKKISDHYKRKASGSVAKKVRSGIVSEAKTLRRLPESKPLLPTKKKAKPPYRYAKKGSFKIIFQVFKKRGTVSVVDVLHDKESPDKWEAL